MSNKARKTSKKQKAPVVRLDTLSELVKVIRENESKINSLINYLIHVGVIKPENKQIVKPTIEETKKVIMGGK